MPNRKNRIQSSLILMPTEKPNPKNNSNKSVIIQRVDTKNDKNSISTKNPYFKKPKNKKFIAKNSLENSKFLPAVEINPACEFRNPSTSIILPKSLK